MLPRLGTQGCLCGCAVCAVGVCTAGLRQLHLCLFLGRAPGVLPVRHGYVEGMCSGLSMQWKVCSMCMVRMCMCRDGGV